MGKHAGSIFSVIAIRLADVEHKAVAACPPLNVSAPDKEIVAPGTGTIETFRFLKR